MLLWLMNLGFAGGGEVPLPLDITDTDIIQKPVNYFMPNLPQYRQKGQTVEGHSRRVGARDVARYGGEMKRPKPTFTTKTGPKGYE